MEQIPLGKVSRCGGCSNLGDLRAVLAFMAQFYALFLLLLLLLFLCSCSQLSMVCFPLCVIRCGNAQQQQQPEPAASGHLFKAGAAGAARAASAGDNPCSCSTPGHAASQSD